MPAQRLRLVFAGTPDFAVPGLRACLDADAEVVGVYTQPDRPAGRGRKLTSSPVKQAALAAGIPVEQPASLKSAEAERCLRDLAPDLMVVIAYGLILPRNVLAIPRLGGWNVHASLLPRWRGAAPIQRAILAGDSETGVCLMRMEAGLDTGPVLLRAATPIHPDDTGGSLHDKLAEMGARLLDEGLRRLAAGETLHATPQPEVGATYAHKLDKTEARLDFTQPAIQLARKVRAFDPWPVAEAEIAGERVRVWAAVALPSPESPLHSIHRRAQRDSIHSPLPFGERAKGEGATPPSPVGIVAASKNGIDVACGEGVLRIVKLQRAGGRVISAEDYLNARPGLWR